MVLAPELSLNHLPRLPKRTDWRIGCIGAGFITFSTDDSMEYSMQLYPTPVNMGTPDAIDPGAQSAPMVAPPPSVPPPTAQDDRPSTQTRTTVITTPAPDVPPPPPSQPPTQLKP